MNKSLLRSTSHYYAALTLASGPLLGLLTLVLMSGDTQHPLAVRTAAIAVWMSVWWLTEAVPLAVTSLLPLVFFPLLGVIKAGGKLASLYT